MNSIKIDIFCLVIDNYGDAGVCTRLARLLANKGHQVKVFTDKPDLFNKLHKAENFTIYDWHQATVAPKNGLVIETFACELPIAYKKTIKAQTCLWINLEYLSAEDWVHGFHKMPSPQADGSNKYFFFPGFTKDTGGLLRSDNELNTYKKLRANRIHSIRQISQSNAINSHTFKEPFFIFLFCYPDAPLAGLQEALSNSDRDIYILLASGQRNIQPQANIKIINLPFVNQQNFDRLLWLSDLNFIRGEDSLAQASWCSTPIIWQAYVQKEMAHMKKLAAWLDIYDPPAQVNKLITAWNLQDNTAVNNLLTQILKANIWQKWQHSSQKYSARLLEQEDLITNLELFYKQKLDQKQD